MSTRVPRYRRLLRVSVAALMLACAWPLASRVADARQAAPSIPNTPLTFGVFSVQFRGDGTFSLAGEGWPSMRGTWKQNDSEIVLRLTEAPAECADAARYTVAVDGRHLTSAVVRDTCTERRMILDRSEWRPAEEALVAPQRRITLTTEPKRGPLPRAAASIGQWPSFRGPQASGVADGQRLPDTWDGATGKMWRTVCQSGRGRRKTDLQ